MAEFRAAISLSFGPAASYAAIAEFVGDLNTVLDFAQKTQAAIDRNDAGYALLRQRDLTEDALADFDFWPGSVRGSFLAGLITSGSPVLRSPAFQRAIDLRVAELRSSRVVRVDRFEYRNPLDLHVNFSGGGIARILEVIRDWGAERRAANARAREAEAAAREAEARASSYEEDARFRREIHDRVRGGLADQDFRIGREELTMLMVDEVQRSIGEIVRADPRVELGQIEDGVRDG